LLAAAPEDALEDAEDAAAAVVAAAAAVDVFSASSM